MPEARQASAFRSEPSGIRRVLGDECHCRSGDRQKTHGWLGAIGEQMMGQKKEETTEGAVLVFVVSNCRIWCNRKELHQMGSVTRWGCSGTRNGNNPARASRESVDVEAHFIVSAA
jgi:hypothetical protein